MARVLTLFYLYIGVYLLYPLPNIQHVVPHSHLTSEPASLQDLAFGHVHQHHLKADYDLPGLTQKQTTHSSHLHPVDSACSPYIQSGSIYMCTPSSSTIMDMALDGNALEDVMNQKIMEFTKTAIETTKSAIDAREAAMESALNDVIHRFSQRQSAIEAKNDARLDSIQKHLNFNTSPTIARIR